MVKDNIKDVIIVFCNQCGARFKIRNPQQGAQFKCNRCQYEITVDVAQHTKKSATGGNKIKTDNETKNDTGASNEKEDNKTKKHPDIIKIELHKPSFFQNPMNETGEFFIKDRKVQKTVQYKKDALNPSTERKERRIFASDIQNRQRLLYLISLYTIPAGIDEDKGTWIRKLPLQVLMFEGVITEIFDWDYAPTSIFTAEGRSFINISQEGEEDLFALLANNYVHNLKLTTAQHRNITAYQITKKGLDYLKKIKEEEKKEVEKLVLCPECHKILLINKKDHEYYLECRTCNYNKSSTITIAEDVSYFCIPYFLGTLTSFEYTPPGYIKKRLYEYFQGNPQDNIKDTLEELIYLSQAKVIISEWLPFGSNQMAALNYKLGSNERIQSAKFTQIVDTDPGNTTLKIPESLTLVKVRDYSLASYVDFEAFSYLPEDENIKQVEEFGVHIDSSGYVHYGLEILAINERRHDKISLDHLPRLLVDILQDSTTIMDTLITNYQRDLLDLIFDGKAVCRDKYYFIIASDIHCFKQKSDEPISSELMRILSQKNYQDEINQITEEIKETALFEDGSVLILGSHGSILVTRTPEKYERLISDFLFTMDIEIFLNNFFTKLFLMNDTLKDIQKLIQRCEIDPNAITIVQQKLSSSFRDIILMEEVRSYLAESINGFLDTLETNYEDYKESMNEALQTFRLKSMGTGLKIRIKDIKKIIKGTQESLQGLSKLTDVISDRQMRRIQETLSNNTRNLEDITKANERSGMSLRILEIILAGGLAFNIMDQFTGEWTLSKHSAVKPILQNIYDIPGIWLAISLMLWALIGVGLFLLMRWIESINVKAVDTRIKLDLPCNIRALKKYLTNKKILTQDNDIFKEGNFVKVSWEEDDKQEWLGNKPKMEIIYDEQNSFILSAIIEVTRPTPHTTSRKLQQILETKLYEAGILSKGQKIR